MYKTYKGEKVQKQRTRKDERNGGRIINKRKRTFILEIVLESGHI